MGKYFGTDGIRGVANTELTCELAFQTGRAAAIVLSRVCNHRAKIYIGKDTRISSDMLECALAAGISSMGADVGLLGYLPTPAVAYLTVQHGADAGIVISASHNPMQYNGIKIFNAEGYKLSDELEAEIEALIDAETTPETGTGAAVGRVTHKEDCAQEYVDYLAKTIDGDLSGLRALVDCANGASSATAPELFKKLRADAKVIFHSPTGTNINENCGSTKMDALRSQVVSGGFDVGVAFDGDADRCLIVDEKGAVVDGDRIMAICADTMRREGNLPHDTFVATVLSNLGLHAYARAHGMQVAASAVGDRNVLELMRKEGYALGGEQSGHVIFLGHSTTGDGELTAVQFLHILKKSGKCVSELVSEIEQYPQVMINVTVPNAEKARVLADDAVLAAMEEVRQQLGDEGRILVRPSGTEPLVRVMVEGRASDLVNALAGQVADVVERAVNAG